MPRTTHIIQRRLRRQQNRGGGKRLAFKLLLLLFSLGTAALLLLTFTSVTSAAAIYAYFTQDLPDFAQIESLGQSTDTFETSKIYAWGDDPDGDGSRDLVLIHEIIDPRGGDRQWLRYDQMPPSIIDATVAIEDRTFWSNPGFDLQGIGRAFYEYVVLGGSIQGGSSITQQLVKNNLIAPERRTVGSQVSFDDYRRKVEELLLAQEISRVYTKEQTLEWYLNTNFYGNLAYGIEAAARVYFNKPAVQLTVAEEHENMVIDEGVIGGVEEGGGALAGERVTDGIAHPLAERPCGGFHAGCFRILRMARRDRMKLAEIFHIILGNRVSGNVQPAVEKHRAMAGREDEAVAVEPLRGIRAVAHRLAEEHGTDLGGAERQAEVAGIAGVDGIDGEASGFVGGLCEQGRIHGKMSCRERFRGAARGSVETPLASDKPGLKTIRLIVNLRPGRPPNRCKR